jgi:glycosyltransferase involved in cell wall biosynthesis
MVTARDGPHGTPARQTIAACMIVCDEEARIPAALASVSWCDEIIVVDSGSRDRTVQLAEAAGARVIEHQWVGFGAQRNIALNEAHTDWVLEVDADERVSPELHADIQRFLGLPPPDDILVCMIARRDRLLGRALGPSAKYPHYLSRLFRRGTYRHNETRLVHEGLWPNERTWAMRGDLEHEYASTWREAVTDAWNYAWLESGHIDPLGSVPAYVKAIVVRPAAKVAFRLIVDGGWRDGWQGFVRVGIEAFADSVVFLRRATGRVPVPRRDPEEHTFGRRIWRAGPVRIVVIDGGRAAVPFLRAAYEAGADVALLTDTETDGGDWLHVQRVPRLGPLHIARGLDAISQMRPVDQLVVGRAQLVLRLINANGRGALPPVNLGQRDPAELVAELKAMTRPTAGPPSPVPSR